MESPKKTEVFSNIKDISAAVRDIVLTAIFIICIFNPSTIKTFITSSGLSELSVFGIGLKVQTVQQNLSAALANTVEPEPVPNAAMPGEVPTEELPPEALNAPVSQELKQAVIDAELIAPQLLPSAGWVFLGKVNEEKTAWVDGSSSTTTADWPVQPGSKLIVKDDVYIRQITSDNWHSSAPVVSVAKVGDTLTVSSLDYSHARAGVTLCGHR